MLHDSCLCSPSLLDLVEIERKLREAKAERERLLRERVSHPPWETLTNCHCHTILDMACWSVTPAKLVHDCLRNHSADVCMPVMHVRSTGSCQDWKAQTSSCLWLHNQWVSIFAALKIVHFNVLQFFFFFSYDYVHTGRKAAVVVGRKKPKRAKLFQRRTTRTRNTTKTRARSKWIRTSPFIASFRGIN